VVWGGGGGFDRSVRVGLHEAEALKLPDRLFRSTRERSCDSRGYYGGSRMRKSFNSSSPYNIGRVNLLVHLGIAQKA